jgi:hypothetical protein
MVMVSSQALYLTSSKILPNFCAIFVLRMGKEMMFCGFDEGSVSAWPSSTMRSIHVIDLRPDWDVFNEVVLSKSGGVGGNVS